MSEAKTPMADHIEHFWNAISEPHVRILVDMRRDHEDGSFHWDSSSFGDDVAKALVGSRASAPERPSPDECCVPSVGEPSFVLLGRDPQAPDLIDQWATDRERARPNSNKPGKARAIAALMRVFKESHPGLGMDTSALGKTPSPSTANTDDLAASIRTAESMLSAHIEEFHDFDYQPHEVPEELQQLRDIQHHLLGSLVNEEGEVYPYPGDAAIPTPSAAISGPPVPTDVLKSQIDRLRKNDFAGMETMRSFALNIIDDLMHSPSDAMTDSPDILLLMEAAQGVLDANADFRSKLPDDWDGDPLEDACEELRIALGVQGGKLATRPSPAPAAVEALEDAETWCEMQARAIGNVDGYDYRSGEEAAYRHAAIELKKRAAALSQSRNERGGSQS